MVRRIGGRNSHPGFHRVHAIASPLTDDAAFAKVRRSRVSLSIRPRIRSSAAGSDTAEGLSAVEPLRAPNRMPAVAARARPSLPRRPDPIPGLLDPAAHCAHPRGRS